jgi:hypothetical protein
MHTDWQAYLDRCIQDSTHVAFLLVPLVLLLSLLLRCWASVTERSQVCRRGLHC